MRILFLSPRQACPPTSGAKLREFYLAKAVAKMAELEWIYFEEEGAGESLQPVDFPANRIAIGRPPRYTPAKIAAGVFGRWPLSVVNYMSPAMEHSIAEACRRSAFDLVHLDAIQLAGYEPAIRRTLPSAPVVYNWHNIESELMRRYAQNTPNLGKKLYANFTAAKLEALERSILRSGFGHLVCSDREKSQLLAIEPEARVETIDNGVDTHYFAAAANNGQGGAAARNHLVFVGTMAYHANIEAAVWFVHHVWPQMQQQFPHLRLSIVGSNPAVEVQQLGSVPGVEVTGTVPDVRSYYAKAFAAIVPLQTGGGTRLKILEAMAACVPVISTAIGAEGLDVRPAKNILIASEPGDWLEAVRELQGQELRQRLANEGRALVASRYDWGVLGHRLQSLYQQWTERK